MESTGSPKEKKALVAHIEREINRKDPDILRGLSPDKRGKLIETVAISVVKEHSGPLPAPETLIEYNEAVPNGADRIVTIFEEQARHRMSLEKVAVGRQTFQSQLGQWFALILGLSTVGCGTWCILEGHDWAGVGLSTSGLITLGVAFLKGKESQKKDLEEKAFSKK
ncbi:DUF2335 domain-containing protein [Spirosoma montaniterrae]|uniref:DUF2335 domain-containing protein n=1 Tax=Spirosoma montaniterrae TaxID=1178516 RepID=A0A1P9X2T0_9BACT|nr:DUF2335 domain-containing protein [Spirosoma montaniterrae]AQG81937.1 hypothetical protein AWR27_23155 [Spirosoma montaniterrae]